MKVIRSIKKKLLILTVLAAVILIIINSCDVDYINGGEARILLVTDDYSLAYNHEFSVTISHKGVDISHSEKMIKNAAGDGASVEFPYMKEGLWTVKVEISRDDTVRLVSKTELKVTSRQTSSVRGVFSEVTGELQVVWDGDDANTPPPSNLTLDSFHFFNCGITGSPEYSEEVEISIGYIRGSQLENIDFLSLLYPDGFKIESGISRGLDLDDWQNLSAGSSVTEVFRMGYSDSGKAILLVKDTNGNSYSMEDEISAESPTGVIPAAVYPEEGETVNAPADTFEWSYSDGGEWIVSQLFVIIDKTAELIHEKTILGPDTVSHDITGLNSANLYNFLILALDSSLETVILDSIIDSGFTGTLLPLVIDNTAEDDETDYISYFLGEFNAAD